MPAAPAAPRSPAPETSIRSHRRGRLEGSVAQQIAVLILSGQLPEGHLFSSEIDFAGQIGISRSALRDAFRILAAKGLVESRPKAGTRVCARGDWSLLDPELLAWQFKADPSLDFLRDLFELRMMVEPMAARLAAVRRSDADVETMRQALDGMAEHGLMDTRGRLADQRFHQVMLEATGNAMIAALASSIMAAVAWTTIYKQRKRALPRDPVPDHRRLFDAIAAGDPALAGEAMTDLVRLALADTEVSLQDD